jgi:co-chaperonin GroES (HSP10)
MFVSMTPQGKILVRPYESRYDNQKKLSNGNVIYTGMPSFNEAGNVSLIVEVVDGNKEYQKGDILMVEYLVLLKKPYRFNGDFFWDVDTTPPEGDSGNILAVMENKDTVDRMVNDWCFIEEIDESEKKTNSGLTLIDSEKESKIYSGIVKHCRDNNEYGISVGDKVSYKDVNRYENKLGNKEYFTMQLDDILYKYNQNGSQK